MLFFLLLILLTTISLFQSKKIIYKEEGKIAILTINFFNINKIKNCYDELLDELDKTLNIPGMRQPTEEEKAAAKKLVEVKLHLKDSKLLFKLESPKEKKKENYKLRNLSYWHFNYYYY